MPTDEPRRPSARATALVVDYGRVRYFEGIESQKPGGGEVSKIARQRERQCADLLAYLADLEAMRDWYADPAHYHTWRPAEHFPGYTTDVLADGGARARAVPQ